MTDDLDVFGAAPGSVQQPPSSVAPAPATSALPTNDLDVFGVAPASVMQPSGGGASSDTTSPASRTNTGTVISSIGNWLDKETNGKEGMLTRAGNDIDSRLQNMNAIQSQRNSGKVSPFPAEYEKASEAAQMAFVDPVTGLIRAAGQDMYGGANPERKQQLDNIGKSIQPAVSAMATVPKGLEAAAAYHFPEAQKYYNQSPDLQAMTKGTENFAGALPMVAPALDAGSALIDTMGSSAAKDAVVNPSVLGTKISPLAAQSAGDKIKGMSQEIFQKAKDNNQGLSSSFFPDLVSRVQNIGQKGEAVEAVPGGDRVQGIIDKWAESAKNGYIPDHDEMLAVDSKLNKLIAGTFKNGSTDTDGQELLTLKGHLQDAMAASGSPATPYAQAAKALWAEKSKMDLLERMDLKADNAQNTAAVRQRAYASLLQNGNAMNMFKNNPEEVALIKEAAKTGNTSAVLREVGSRLTATIAGAAAGSGAGPIGTVMGAVAGHVVASAARNGADYFGSQAPNALKNGIMSRAQQIYDQAMARTPWVPPQNMKYPRLAAPTWTGAQNHPGFAGPVTGEVMPPPMTPFQARAQAAKAAAAQPTPETGNMFTGRRGTSFADNTNLPETTATIAARIGEDPRPLVQQFHGATPEQFENMTPDQKEAAVATAQKNRAMQTKTGPVLNVGENADQFGQTPTGSMQRPDRPNIYQPTSTETEASGVKKPYSQTATGTSQRPFQGEMPNQFEAAAQSKYGEAKAASEAELNQRWQQYKSSAEYQSSDAAKERQAQSDKYTGKDAPKTSSFSQMPDNSGRYSVDDFNFVKSNKGGPIQFADQKKAAQWILREGHANSPDQIFDIANHPSGKGYTVKQSGISDAAPAGPQRTANTRFEQPENNAKVEGVNQGKSLNPPILPTDHPDAPYVPYEPKLSKPLTRSQTAYKSPILKWIADNGGVRVGSDLDKKLRPMDIAPGIKGTPVGLYKDDSVRGKIGVPRANIDTVSPKSFNEQFGTNYAGDEHGYMKPEDIVDAISNEQFGQKLGSEYQKQRMNHVADENAIQESQTKNGLHADITKNSTLKPTRQDIENMAQKVAKGEDHDKVVKDYINDTNSRMKNNLYEWKSGGPVKATKGQIAFKLKKTKK